MCQTSDRGCLSLLSVVECDSAPFSWLFVSSLVAALFEGQWSALPTSAHSRGDGSLSGQGFGQCCVRSLENKLSCCGVARANTTPVQSET